VNDLSFNWIVFYSFLIAIYWNVFCVFFLIDLWNIFCLILNSVIIGITTFSWNIIDNFLFFILNNGSLVWNVFNS